MQLVSRKPVDTYPSRMGALAKLPVFLDLQGKRVIVAGGTAAAAWKVELLVAAGAHVHVYAEAFDAEMTACIAQSSGMVERHAEAWSETCFVGAALALADVESDHDAKAFHDAARLAGVPVNVIDRPAFCQFQFGSIVNRSPVVIGISTDGAAPILAQAIRRRIEVLLPPAVAAWAQLARELRGLVGARLARGMPRRRFWEVFTERAFGSAPPADARENLERMVDTFAATVPAKAGRVTLVGAGPGDAELLTLKAVRAMQSADVILFDDLVSNDVLELARREAKRMAVGKRGQRASCTQTDINDLMLKLSLQGKHVVRLKCGDPMIFGRAGEEIAALARHGIAVEVVPGITSALAAAARLGVSLTHRDHAQSVRFVTGHSRNGALPDTLDWRGLADPNTTLVFYMAGNTATEIADRLMTAGLDGATPTHVMAGVSTPDEVSWSGALRDLSQAISQKPNELPVLIAIGSSLAAGERSSRDWLHEPAVICAR